VVPIRLPSLRKRKEDIPLLVDHFLQKYSKIFNKDIRELSSYAMQVLMEYDYPGNVRELENIIERGVALENSNIILPESLTLSSYQRDEHNEMTTLPDNDAEVACEVGLEEYMADKEKMIITEALIKAGHSKMKAAELLKISFRSLRYKVKKYQIS
jgi:two-component system response regulator PilR (NtrC family)